MFNPRQWNGAAILCSTLRNHYFRKVNVILMIIVNCDEVPFEIRRGTGLSIRPIAIPRLTESGLVGSSPLQDDSPGSHRVE